LVLFNAQVTGMNTPVTYNWDFGDGQSGSGQNPIHFYFAPGFYDVTVSANDGNCSANTVIQVFVVPDMVPPVASCNMMVMLPLGANGTAFLPTSAVDNGSFDNCSNFSMSLSQDMFDCNDLGNQIVTLTITDFSGFSSTCTAVVAVKDQILPTLTCPANITVDGAEDANGNCVATVSGIDPLASDNCGIVSVVHILNGATTALATAGTASGLIFNEGLTIVRYIVSDNSGNTKECIFTVTVEACDCDAACLANALVINTGWDPITSSVTPLGQYTPFWTLVASPNSGGFLPRPAYAVSPNAAWLNQTNSRWLSAYPNAAFNANNPSPQTAYTFDNCFCVCADETDLTLDMSALADNNLSLDLVTDGGVFVGDILDITSTTSTAFTTPTTAIKNFTLQKGNYCLRAGLRNLSGVAMGFNIKGTITGAGMLKSVCCGVSNFVTGQKVLDTNCNGVINPGEPASAGWTIQAIDPITLTVVATAVTDNFGYYVFENLPPGNYTISELQKPGYTQTFPAGSVYNITVQDAAVIGGLDFANCAPTGCTANFTQVAIGNCGDYQFFAAPTGTAPFTYQWDFNGLGSSTLDNPTFSFPISGVSQNYTVCLQITGADNCTVSFCKVITVPGDVTPPVITCPQNITLNTNPNVCTAAGNFTATATDNCPPVTISYQLSGATLGTSPNTNYNLGNTVVMAKGTDQAGNMANCMFTVTVQDKQAPSLNCQSPPTVSVPWCNNGANVTFNLPIATDNCGGPVNVSCSALSGAFFPCGSTTVNCTGTDQAGNIGNCNIVVNVNCECASITSSTISCSATDPKIYNFEIQVLNKTGGNSCTITTSNVQAGVTLAYTSTWNMNTATITGTLQVTDPVPNPLALSVTMSCSCSFGPVSCTLPVSFIPPCCEEIWVNQEYLCPSVPVQTFEVQNCTNLYDVLQTAWYYTNAPCPPSSWGLPKQVKPGCSPLTVLPEYLSGDICVYAEVTLGNNPCKKLISFPTEGYLCRPPQGSIPSTEACYSGAPIVPPSFQLTVISDCPPEIEWLDPNGQLVATGVYSYQPPAMSFTGNPTDCYQDVVYTVRLITPCDNAFIPAVFRMYNQFAPIGTLNMNPVDQLDLCPGEDIELSFVKACTSPVDEWTWYSRTNSTLFAPIVGAGTANPNFNSNRIYEDTWFQVEATNGVCLPRVTDFFVPVREVLQGQNFQAAYDDPCNPAAVQLILDFVPEPGCNFEVKWYHNGNLIQTQVSAVAPFDYLWVPGAGELVSGVFYAELSRDCCAGTVRTTPIELLPAPKLVLITPCFICKNSTTQISADILNLPGGITPQYNWSATGGGNILSGANTETITVNTPGDYQLSVQIGSCLKTGVVSIVECSMVSIEDGGTAPKLWLAAIPNPTSGLVQFSWSQALPDNSILKIMDEKGREINTYPLPNQALQLEIQLEALPAGIYFVRFETPRQLLGTLKVIKQ
jgi:hypothetical protein